MLYQLYEFQRQAMAPMRAMADHGQYIFRSPFNPAAYTPGGRVLAAALDVFEHSTRPYGKPTFGFTSTLIKGKEVAVTEEVVARAPFGQLKHFKRDTNRDDPKILVVAPMSGHYATLLRGTVEALLPDHEVYITDWRDAKLVPISDGDFDLDVFIDYLVDYFGLLGPDTHVMAVCQPSVPVFAALALMEENDAPNRPASITMMGGPIDTRVNPTEVNRMATARPLAWFRQNVIGTVPPPNDGMFRKVYPGFMQLAGFMSMNLGNHMVRHHDMFRHLVEGDGESAESSRAFYEEYRAVMDLTAEFYLQTVETVFQRHLLPKGEMMHREQLVNPAAISKTPMFTIEGERDDISGVGQTKAAHDLTPNLPDDKREHYEQPGVGHYGIFNGRRWRDQIAPQVRDFVLKHRQ
ncbi:MAG: polyhydroxyalkanoate depolymerase [Pseudomonadota bacterium]